MPHLSLQELDKILAKAKKKVEVGGVYYHYKNPNKYYVVEFVGFIEESNTPCVIYRALYGKGIVWVRTLEVFLSKVDGKKRFNKVNGQ